MCSGSKGSEDCEVCRKWCEEREERKIQLASQLLCGAASCHDVVNEMLFNPRIVPLAWPIAYIVEPGFSSEDQRMRAT